MRSARNPRFRRWLRMVSEASRPETPWIAVEGLKAISEVARDRPVELLLYSDSEAAREIGSIRRARETVRLSPALLHRLSSVHSPQGILAFFSKPGHRWRDLGPRILYLDGLQDPGNVGTLLRTARATGLFSLVAGPSTVSFFNDKVVRASAASLFRVPFLERTEVAELDERGYTLWAADPDRGTPLFEADFRVPFALLLGSEGRGLQPQVDQRVGRRVRIPMADGAESLNAAVAGSLLLYEVYRRGCHG